MILFASIANWNFDSFVRSIIEKNKYDNIVLVTVRNPRKLKNIHPGATVIIPPVTTFFYLVHFIYSKLRKHELYESYLFKCIFIVFDYEVLIISWFLRKRLRVLIGWAACINSTLNKTFLKDVRKVLYSGNSHIGVQKITQKVHNDADILDFFVVSSLRGYEFSDFIVVESEYSRSTFIENGINAKKVLIYNFIPDNGIYRIQPDVSLDINIFFLGFRCLKGVDVFEEIIRELGRCDLGDRTLNIYYSGYSQYKCGNERVNVTPLGSLQQSDFFKILTKMDLILLPTWEDGGPRLLSEAINLGIFCLGSEFSKLSEFQELGMSKVIRPNNALLYLSEILNFKKRTFRDFSVIDEHFNKLNKQNFEWIRENLL